MELIERLNWRYATKAMNGKKIPEETINRILEAARLAPTSSGLQPFEIIVITNQDLKEKIKPIAYNQPQITDCSHLLVFAAWDTYTPERINEVFDRMNAERGFTSEGGENYRKMLLANYPSRSNEENFIHTSKQAYIAFGITMTAAAFENVDSTPMEGFDPKALDELLSLNKSGLKSCLLLPLGYRDPEKDWLATLQKVRRPKDQFVIELN